MTTLTAQDVFMGVLGEALAQDRLAHDRSVDDYIAAAGAPLHAATMETMEQRRRQSESESKAWRYVAAIVMGNYLEATLAGGWLGALRTVAATARAQRSIVQTRLGEGRLDYVGLFRLVTPDEVPHYLRVYDTFIALVDGAVARVSG